MSVHIMIKTPDVSKSSKVYNIVLSFPITYINNALISLGFITELLQKRKYICT